MDDSYIINRIEELEREIAALAPGTVSPKTVKNKVYYYHRYSRNGERFEEYISPEKVSELRAEIENRKALEAELKRLKQSVPTTKKKTVTARKGYRTYVRVGEQLLKLAEPVRNFKKRECYHELYDYVSGEHSDKVFVLYGLRRTGKTTLIRQILLDMTPEQLSASAFIQIKSSDTLSAINTDLKHLEEKGCKYVFIDEVTLMEDFIEGAALFSDIYASSGMKIVLSGTDSLGFIFTKSEQLFDRCILLHTTIIPYREFESVLGIHGIDEFIRYGGTMSMGGINYNKKSSFATKDDADEYVDSAIARNIQHSLKYYQDGGHFRQLYELYINDELTSAINRVVEDMNHSFTKETLIKTFMSNDLSLVSRNLLNDRNESFDLYDNIDRGLVVSLVKDMLDILDKEEQQVEVNEAHAYQIKEYLTLLDLIREIDILYFPAVNNKSKKIVISQPGLRYAQADALLRSLLLDAKFSRLSATERKRVLDRLLSAIQGRMLEDIILLETKMACPDKEVFQLQFAVGEFDMVVYDPVAVNCEIYEIKHSKEAVFEQSRHLIDTVKCAETEHRFGRIMGKYVIYCGEDAELNGIKYLNAEEYLKSL